MKNLNIEALGLQEMTKEEMREIEGGHPIAIIAAAAYCCYVIGKAIGYATN